MSILYYNYFRLDAEEYYPDKTRIVIPSVRGISTLQNVWVCVVCLFICQIAVWYFNCVLILKVSVCPLYDIDAVLLSVYTINSMLLSFQLNQVLD